MCQAFGQRSIRAITKLTYQKNNFSLASFGEASMDKKCSNFF